MPSSDMCQVVVLTGMVFVVSRILIQMYCVSPSFVWQDFSGRFWLLLDRIVLYCVSGLMGICHALSYAIGGLRSYCSLAYISSKPQLGFCIAKLRDRGICGQLKLR